MCNFFNKNDLYIDKDRNLGIDTDIPESSGDNIPLPNYIIYKPAEIDIDEILEVLRKSWDNKE